MTELKLDRIEWVADPAAVKAGILMPQTCLSRGELEALVACLGGLE